MVTQKQPLYKIGEAAGYFRRGIYYPGVIRQDLGILRGAGRRYRITPPDDGKHDLAWFVFDVPERSLIKIESEET